MKILLSFLFLFLFFLILFVAIFFSIFILPCSFWLGCFAFPPTFLSSYANSLHPSLLPLPPSPCSSTLSSVCPGSGSWLLLYHFSSSASSFFLELSSWRLPLPVLPARDIPIHSHPHSLTFTLTLIPGFRFAFTALALLLCV